MQDFSTFQQTVWDFYRAHGRHDLPWRQASSDDTFDPYKVMVSEIMLQQTQVARVISKFQEFIVRFPNVQTLATAQLGDVLMCWNGLGYNRRAKFLWQAAQRIVRDHNGELPREHDLLVALPGIGTNTAGAIMAYAYNEPVVFIETNIRTVFIHHYLPNEDKVSDAVISELVRASLPPQNVREWYWALMDYGTHLKQTVGNVSRQSKVFAKQSKFEGSKRQVRGAVLRTLGKDTRKLANLQSSINDERLVDVLAELTAEGLVVRTEHGYRLP